MHLVATNDSLQYNFTAVDGVYDYLLSLDMRPIVELSWMPAAIASNPSRKVYDFLVG